MLFSLKNRELHLFEPMEQQAKYNRISAFRNKMIVQIDYALSSNIFKCIACIFVRIFWICVSGSAGISFKCKWNTGKNVILWVLHLYLSTILIELLKNSQKSTYKTAWDVFIDKYWRAPVCLVWQRSNKTNMIYILCSTEYVILNRSMSRVNRGVLKRTKTWDALRILIGWKSK